MSVIPLIMIAAFFGLLFVYSSRYRDRSWTFSGFFLGGRNIGAPLTREVFWGTSFSLANGIFYFAILGYYNSLAVIWLQIPWMAAIWYLAWKLPVLMEITGRHTIHGFLGSIFGDRARWIASVVTIFAFAGALAFELNVSAEIASSTLGSSGLLIVLTLVAAITAASYTDTAGFVGGAKTDRLQNWFGLLAVVILLYSVTKLDVVGVQGFENNLSKESIFKSLFDFGSLNLIAVLGILCFASTFNIVDMSNWQAIAANSDADHKSIKRLQWAMRRSTILILFFPALAGAFLGYIFQSATINGNEISEDQILPLIIQSVANTEVGVVGLGFVLAGLLGTALSTVDSYLLSTSQTITWDLKKKLEKVQTMPEEERSGFEKKAVRIARSEIYLIALISVGVFMFLRSKLGDETVFVLQFVIFGLVVALAPATFLAISAKEKAIQLSATQKLFGQLSIAFGFLAGLCVALVVIFGNSEFNAYAWAPIVTALTSLLLISPVAFLNSKIKNDN